MIITLNDATTHAIAEELSKMREERGEAATDRVLTLLISCSEDELEAALRAANEASREHPCRVIALVPRNPDNKRAHLDAQIRFGADSGAGEVIVLLPSGELTKHLDTLAIPLMVSDTPAVAWWPGTPPPDPSRDAIGAMASSRITDASQSPHPLRAFDALRCHANANDVDLAWTRLTLWRGELASILDQPPHLPVLHCRVCGQKNDLSTLLMAAWLRYELRVPVSISWNDSGRGLTSVALTRANGDILLTREANETSKGNETARVPILHDQARLLLPAEKPQMMSLPCRSTADCLMEELAQLYPDDLYASVIHSDFDFSGEGKKENAYER